MTVPLHIRRGSKRNNDSVSVEELDCSAESQVLIPLVFGDEFLAQGLHLKSHQRCSAWIRTWLSADQSSSSTLTESSFICDPTKVVNLSLEGGDPILLAI